MKNVFKKENKMLYTQILFVAMAFTVMVLLSYLFMNGIVRSNLVRNAESVLDYTESRITSRLMEFESTLDSFAEITCEMALGGGSVDDLQKYINDISNFTYLGGGEVSGIRGFYGYFEQIEGGPVLITPDGSQLYGGANAEDTDWYRMATGTYTIIETTPYINSDDETVYTYAKSIYDEIGRRIGIVCMDVDIDMMGSDIITTALNQGGYGMLMNQELMTLFHPNTEFRGIFMYDPFIPVYVLAEDVANGNEVFETPMVSYRNEESLAFFRTLSNGWHLGIVTPQDQYYSSINTMAVTLFALGAALAAVLIAILIRLDADRAKSDDENRKKSMFLANMSHEIRTPINAIVGMSAIGRTAGTLDRKDYCFNKIDNASKHLLGVINDILDMSKIEANKIELSDTDFNFEKMLQQAVNVTNFRADEKRQKLSVYIDKLIPKVLHADDQRLVQVVTNLLSNAVKFTPEEGSIVLRASLSGEDNGIFTVKIQVEDNGIGMSPEQQAKLFQSFQQAESSTTRKYGGTGLGLAISKSIVELMGGKIWVESEFGKGSVMSFTIKVKEGEDKSLALSRLGLNWENVRILTVDDDPDILLYFKEIVTGFGANCEVAENADDALKLIDDNGGYNIYFVDLRMPDVDGISLTRMIREREKDPGNSIVIMISSADLSSIEGEAKKAGVNKFLLKPLFPSSLADVISECIGIVNEKTEEAVLNIEGIFAGKRVLFAEDIEINREIVISLLEQTLVEVECAENGVEAVQMFSNDPERYDMIFMDVQMPEMDGYEATRQIRSLNLPRAGKVPIVAMTANVFREDIEHCLAAGMNGHLGKPLDVNEMVETMMRYMKVKVQK